MRKKTARSSPSSRSWQEIRQSANRKVVTAHARRKILKGAFRGVLAVATAGGVAAAVYFGFGYWQEGVQKMNTVLPAQPLREIVFTTDGVLSKQWVESVLALADETDIMSIDIQQKKRRLEGYGQVKSAVIRRLSDRLAVSIQERSPILRLRIRDEDGGVLELLVDGNGHVYEGLAYDRFEISTLPFLAGVILQRSGDGFRRLPRIDQVEDLLATAQRNFPSHYRSWKVVDLSEPDLIKIRSEDFEEIVFAAGRYTEQLKWLDLIVESNRRQMVGLQERVDLSLGNQVVVR